MTSMPLEPGRAAAPRTRLIQTAIGDYRQAFLDVLVSRLGDRFDAWAGDVYFDGVTRTKVDLGSRLHRLQNRYLLGRRLLWQSGSLRAGVTAPLAVLELNPRILTTWLTLIVRRIRGRPTLLWGHAWSRSGRSAATNRLRTVMWRLANGVIMYTHQQANELREADPRARVWVAPNAIYSADTLSPADGDQPPTDFIFVGRLVPAKKPDVLVEAFRLALGRLPAASTLIVVGDGPMARPLRDAAASLPPDRIDFTGHVADPAKLRALYARSMASVSPGFVGLSITQSLGYGVPMIIARDEPHSPEIEAAVEGWNADFYAPSTPEALADAMAAVAARPADRAQRALISAACRERYSAEAMADGFIQALNGVARAPT